MEEETVPTNNGDMDLDLLLRQERAREKKRKDDGIGEEVGIFYN